MDEKSAGDEQTCKDCALLPRHLCNRAGHQRLHANTSNIRYYMLEQLIYAWWFITNCCEVSDDLTISNLFVACENDSVLSAVNGLKLRAPHLTTGTKR